MTGPRAGSRAVASVTLVLDDRGHVTIDGTGVSATAVMLVRTSNVPRPDWFTAENLGIDPQTIDVLDTLRRSLPGQS